MRVHTVKLREAIDVAEEKYITAKNEGLAQKKVFEAKMKATLETGMKTALDMFIQEKTAATLDVVGPNGDLSPFMAQITQEVADFSSHTARIELEYSGFRMRLQTTGVLQQIEMLLTMARVLPIMCHMSYPAPAQWLIGLPASPATITPVASTVSKPATMKGGSAKGTRTLSTMVVSTTSTTTTITMVSTLVVSTTAYYLAPHLSSELTAAQAQALISAFQQTYGVTTPPGFGAMVPGGIRHPRQQTPMGYGCGLNVGLATNPPPPFYTNQDFQSGPVESPQHPAMSATSRGVYARPSSAVAPKRPHWPEEASTSSRSGSHDRDGGIDDTGFITLDSNGDGDSDDNCHIVEDPVENKVLEKRARVGGTPPNSALNQATAAVGTDAIREMLGAISSSKDDTPAANTMPAAMPVKTKMKKKKKTKKKSDQSKVGESSESDNPRAHRLGDQLLEDKIKEEGWIRVLNTDFQIIKDLRQEFGLPAQTVTQYHMMPHLECINKYQQDLMHEAEWSKAFIWTVAMVQKKFQAELKMHGPKVTVLLLTTH